MIERLSEVRDEHNSAKAAAKLAGRRKNRVCRRELWEREIKWNSLVAVTESQSDETARQCYGQISSIGQES